MFPRCLAVAVCLVIACWSLPADDKDFADQLPRIPPRTPAEEQKTIRPRPGFKMELVAAEPLVQSPVAMDFDENGRLFVVEYPEYNQAADYKGKGCVKLLEDTNGDGRYDRASVYVDNLRAPTAVACWDGGVFVGAVPDVLYCKDTNGDGKADIRTPILTGFSRDAAGEAMLNSFRWGLDNRFHLSTSLAGGMVRLANKDDSKAVAVRGQGFLFEPRTGEFEITGGGGQHGMSMDDWGRKFVCSNSEPIHLVMYDNRYLTRNPYIQAPAAAVNIAPAGKFTKIFRISPNEPWRVLRTKLRAQGAVPGSDEGGQPSGFFTGATGVTIYRGDAYPDEYRGNAFVGEVSGNLVYRAKLEPKGLGLVAQRADTDVEFLASTDNWFRPVQFANGPDGCLYVVDMYRELIEGAAFLPPQILKHLDVSSGIDKGRIWRIVPENFQRPAPPRLGESDVNQLVKLLEHKNGWHRDTAARLLYQRQDKQAVAPLKALALKSDTRLGRMHALHALAGLKELDSATLMHGLRDVDPFVRIHAMQLAESFRDDAVAFEQVVRLARSTEPTVRYQAAFSLGAFRGQTVQFLPGVLVELLLRDGAEPWLQLAVQTSLGERRGEVFAQLLESPAFRKTAHGRAFLGTLAGQIGSAGRKEEVKSFSEALDKLPDAERAQARELVQALVGRLPAAARAQLAVGKTGELLKELLQQARKTASDEKQAAASRATAVRSLALAEFAEVKTLFSDLLQVRQPQVVQTAALETLARFDQPDVARLLLEAWPGLSPQVRPTAAETLFARPAWIAAFLDAVEQGKIRPAEMDPARIQLLQAYPDEKLRTRAAKLFAASRLVGRDEVVKAYQKALTVKGDAPRGKVLFKKECSACHQLEGVGTAIGADLSAIRDRGSEAVLLNILDPNREVKPQYLSYVLTTKAGKILTGLITAETPTSLTLRRPDGTSETVLRSEVDELHSSGLSFMPEGVEKQLDVQAMADLLAYLNSLK